MSIISTVPKGAAVEGINPNLLRNWYFVGGGTGRGVFPVNSRGLTSYNSSSDDFGPDAWKVYSGGTLTLTSAGAKLSVGRPVVTDIPRNDSLWGRWVTLSVLTSSGLYVASGTVPSSPPASQTNIVTIDNSVLQLVYRVYGSVGTTSLAWWSKNADVVYYAFKVEVGDQQTLAHQENGVWVLTDTPNYEEEYYRCVTSNAVSGDTYANQQVSNITVQCNSVGSSSLRYYNKLIQSTHKVLDSTFSNPAAQTSDITVTTYDGYLDFSNGFASGATTNITLVLGTSGPVLSTTTTAPS